MYLHLEIEFTHSDLFKASHWKVCEACPKIGRDGMQPPFQHCMDQ